MPDTITRLFKEAYDTFPPLEGKPSDDDLLVIRETLLPLLMVIPYDQLNGVHFLPLYNKNIATDTTTVIRVCAEAAHKSRHDDYASYEVAEQGVAKFLRGVVDKIWYNDLKDAETFYTKVTAINIVAFFNANSGGLHAINMISLCTNMTQYYMQVDGIP